MDGNFSKLTWEVIENSSFGSPASGQYINTIRRARLPDGWLVEKSRYIKKIFQGTNAPDVELGVSVSITYVPDINGEWLRSKY